MRFGLGEEECATLRGIEEIEGGERNPEEQAEGVAEEPEHSGLQHRQHIILMHAPEGVLAYIKEAAMGHDGPRASAQFLWRVMKATCSPPVVAPLLVWALALLEVFAKRVRANRHHFHLAGRQGVPSGLWQ